MPLLQREQFQGFFQVPDAIFQSSDGGAVVLQLLRHAEERQHPSGECFPHGSGALKDGFDLGDDAGGWSLTAGMTSAFAGEPFENAVGLREIMLRLSLVMGVAVG